MNAEDAKFLLRACRPDGRDAADPTFAEALAAAERDPQLRAWLERERAFDSAVAAKLQAVAPPPELKQAILAGARVSRPGRRWWGSQVWLAAAAAVAVALAGWVMWRGFRAPRPAEAFARFAHRDLADAHDQHVGEPARLTEVQARLAQLPVPLRSAVELDLRELQQRRCRSVRFGGHDVFEICFQREGVWFHLYAVSAGAVESTERDALHLRSDEGLTTAVWSKAGMAYALVSRASPEVMRRLL